MPNKYYYENNASPPSATKTPPSPGTKGIKGTAPKFTPVTEEPKKGM